MTPFSKLDFSFARNKLKLVFNSPYIYSNKFNSWWHLIAACIFVCTTNMATKSISFQLHSNSRVFQVKTTWHVYQHMCIPMSFIKIVAVQDLWVLSETQK